MWGSWGVGLHEHHCSVHKAVQGQPGTLAGCCQVAHYDHCAAVNASQHLAEELLEEIGRLCSVSGNIPFVF